MMADNILLLEEDDDVGGDDDIFVYTGGEQEVPRDVKRVRIAENVDTILAGTFRDRTQLIEAKGHNKIKKIEHDAFYGCPSLRWVRNMQGVIEIEDYAFSNCYSLSELEFDRLEIIGICAFAWCTSLRSIHMPSVRRVGRVAFQCCGLADVVFGKNLERIEAGMFYRSNLRRIVIPLNDNLIIGNNSFSRCENLSRVGTLAGEIHTTISSLHLKTWRNEMLEEINRINQTLPNIGATKKTQAIQEWIARVLSRMVHYKTEHRILLKETAALLELALWKANLHENIADDAAAAQEGVRVTRGHKKRKRKDRCITSGASVVIKNVLPFLALE